MNLKIVVVIIVSIGISLSAVAQKRKKKGIPPEKPKLVIGIVVEQMRQDYLFKYWDKIGDDGFKRLIFEGADCKNVRYNYLFTQEGVGHATIATGTNPTTHGIISTSWYDRLNDKTIYCTTDETERSIGSRGSVGKMSPRNLQVTTFGDELKLSTKNKSKVFGVSIRDCSAILMAGHKANAAFWFDDKNGHWVTSSYYMNSLPRWVSAFNDKKLPDLYLDREWNTLLPIYEYSESIKDNNRYEKGYGQGFNSFPYDLKKLRKDVGEYELLKTTPFGNTFTKDFALATIVNEKLGQDIYPDFISISFSATDFIGDAFGPASVEVEDAFLRLDKDLAHFLKFIDSYIGRENILLFLTSDHGATHNPEFLKDEKIPAGSFNPTSSLTLLKSYLRAIYGQGKWINSYIDQQIYLNHVLIENSKIPLREIQEKTARFMIQFEGVANAVTATTLQTTNFNDGIFKKIQNSYNQKSSADVIINLSPGWVAKSDNKISNNSSYSYETHVPLIWYGWKAPHKTIYLSISVTDIAPTLSAFLNIPYPNACTGKLIQSLF